MDFFDGASEKLAREQKQRREKLRKQREEAEKRRLKADEATKRMEAEAAKQRLIQQQKEREIEVERLRELRLTGGVQFSLALHAVVIDGAEDDKCLLPESALEELTRQDAFNNVALFRLTLDSDKDKTTHCGVREFSSRPGTIAITPKIIRSLGIDPTTVPKHKPLVPLVNVSHDNHIADRNEDDITTGTSENNCNSTDIEEDDPSLFEGPLLHIKFIRMNKIRYVQFQPLKNQFNNLGPVKQVLEENLMHHSTLSVGDVVTVWYRGVAHDLKATCVRCVTIQELMKRQQTEKEHSIHEDEEGEDDEFEHNFGTLVQTDVEVQLDVSDEYVAHQEKKKLLDKVSSEGSNEGDRVVSHTASSSSNSSMHSLRGRTLGESVSGSASSSSATSASTCNSALPAVVVAEEVPEPPPDTDASQVVRCKVKGRDGSGLPFVLSRSFMKTNPFLALFQWVRSNTSTKKQGSGDVSSMYNHMHTLLLRTHYPVREFAEVDTELQGKTFEDLNISHQELFHLEVR